MVAAGTIRIEPVADKFETSERLSAVNVEPAVIGVVDQFPELFGCCHPAAVDIEAQLPAAPAASAAGAPDNHNFTEKV